MADMEQRTPEWYRARMGQLGASQVAKAIAKGKGGDPSSTRRNLIAEIVSMRLTGECPEGFTSKAIEWGIDNEPIARSIYEIKRDLFVEEVGWVQHPSMEWTGCSPDGLVGSDGLIEIKCPNTATHIDYLLGGCVPSEYKLQMLWQMVCTGRKWCDFVSFDPRMPRDLSMFIIRYDFDEQRAIEVSGAVKEFLNEVDLVIERLSKLKEQ